jgi:hypothetical protein
MGALLPLLLLVYKTNYPSTHPRLSSLPSLFTESSLPHTPPPLPTTHRSSFSSTTPTTTYICYYSCAAALGGFRLRTYVLADGAGGMGRSPCCEKAHTNKGAWTKEEDQRLIAYIKAHGEGCWRSLPKAAGIY